jgi:hypothetical protein
MVNVVTHVDEKSHETNGVSVMTTHVRVLGRREIINQISSFFDLQRVQLCSEGDSPVFRNFGLVSLASPPNIDDQPTLLHLLDFNVRMAFKFWEILLEEV